jgi:hypothetical protein
MGAFTNTNDILTGRAPAVFPAGAEIVAQRGTIALVAADLDADDAGAVSILPAGCVPVSFIYDSDDLDTNASPTIVASIGVMNTAGDDLDTVLVAGITASQTGVGVEVTSKETIRLAATQADRKIGIKFTAASATKAAGTVGLTMLYRAA